MTPVRFHPLDDRVVIKQLEPESRTPGGIILPDKAQKPTFRGVVVAVGPGKRTDSGERLPMQVAVGNVVAFPFAHGEITEGDEKYLVVRESDVLAIIEDAPPPVPQYAGE